VPSVHVNLYTGSRQVYRAPRSPATTISENHGLISELFERREGDRFLGGLCLFPSFFTHIAHISLCTLRSLQESE
jgi:hypothetical protein